MRQKLLIMIISGLLMLYPIYPFLHETGHFLLTVMLGGTVREFTLFPPSVVVLPSTLSEKELFFVCLAGPLFPCFLGFFPWENILWWFSFLLRGFNVVTCSMCLFVLAFSEITNFSFNEDMIRATSLCENKRILIIIFSFMLLIQFFLLIKYSIYKMNISFPQKENESLEIS